MHNKNVMIDGKLSTMGTCNFDSRSFEVNYEINTVFYNKELTEQLRDQFFKDIKECEEVKLESILRKNIKKDCSYLTQIVEKLQRKWSHNFQLKFHL